MSTAPTKSTAPYLAKVQGAVSQKTTFKESNMRHAITTPKAGTAAHAALLALVAAGPAGVCPQQFFDDAGLSLRHAVHDLRRRRWRIESKWSRQRVESEMTYVLVEVQA